MSADQERVEGSLDKHQEKFAGQLMAENAFSAWAPRGTQVRYMDNKDMEEATYYIAQDLQAEGVYGVKQAFQSLRAGSFRADLWRLLQLWDRGGVYLDVSMKLKKNLAEFVDFERDKLVLVIDPGVPKECCKHNVAFFNAVMASVPRNPYLLAAIKAVVQNINRHSYDWCFFTSMTGPDALGNAIAAFPDYRKDMRIEYEWKLGNVRKIGDDAPGWIERSLMDKDESLHDSPVKNQTHYVNLWEHRQLYCDEKGPEHSLC